MLTFARKRCSPWPEPAGKAINYTYTGQKLVTVLDETKTPSETHTFAYDGSYRVASNTQGPRGTLNYSYTPDDRVQTMAVSSGPTQTYAYYPDGSLNTIQWSVVGGSFKYTYTPTGQYQEITFPSGQKRSYAYDDQGRLTQLANTLSATNLATFTYGYDHDWTSGSDTMLGQRTSMTANVPAQGLNAAESKYTYDPLYQLVKAQYPAAVFGGEAHEWTYDALGNRLSSKLNGTGPSYTYLKNGTNPLNGQRLSSDGVNAYTYDPNGSQLTRTGPGGNFGFGYDTDNRLTSIAGSETATYAYDYQGRRILKTEAGVTTTYLYDGLNPIAETVSGSPKYVLNGPSIDEPLAISASGTISYLNADGLGSIIATNNAAGTISHSLSFDAWGVPKNEIGTRAHGFTYTGREASVAGMHFYRARFMQAGAGRFSREDPKRFESGPNFFVYAGGSPLSMVDPLGTKFGDWWDVRATIAYYDEVATTTTNPWAAASASIASALLKISGVREAQEASEFAGYGNDTCAAQRAMMALLKGLTFAGPLLGSRATVQTASRFFVDPRAAKTARAAYWRVRGGATHVGIRFQNHHWFEAERFGGTNAGWNLFAIPRLLNAYMNGAPSTLWAEKLVRGTVLAAPGVGVAAGVFAGLFDPACACKPGD
jgi:RHS repeat-associated protein